MRVVKMVGLTLCLGLALPGGPVVASGHDGREALRVAWTKPGPLVAGLASRARAGKTPLKVKLEGPGSYKVVGKGVKVTRSRSASFRLKPGVYRVRAAGARVQPRKIVLRAGKPRRVSVTFGVGAPGAVERLASDAFEAAWSPDGTHIAYFTGKNPELFVKNLVTGATTRVGVGVGSAYAWSPDGTRIAFDDDNLNVSVVDLSTGQVTVVSTDESGVPGEGSILGCSTLSASGGVDDQFHNRAVWSPDGTRIAFTTRAPNLGVTYGSDVVVKNLVTGKVDRVSSTSQGKPAYGFSDCGAWSPDGSRIAFQSNAMNLGDTRGEECVFVKDLATGAVQMVSVDAQGRTAPKSEQPAWSPDGTALAFSSWASNLVTADTNGRPDVFLKNLSSGSITRISTTSSGKQLTGTSLIPVWSPDGNAIAFTTTAKNLLRGLPLNSDLDLVVKNLTTGSVVRVPANAEGQVANFNRNYNLAWSPDGQRVTFDSGATNLVATREGKWAVYVKTLMR